MSFLLQIGVAIWIIQSCSPSWIASDDHDEESIRQEQPQQIANKQIEKKEDKKTNFFSDMLNSEEQKPIRLLLLGSDQREEEQARADVLMIAQYTPSQKDVKLVSIMRDTYVYIPGYGQSKINHSYFWGGEKLLKETIYENFNVELDHVVKIDFEGFIKTMELAFPEGLTVSVSKEMIDYWKWDKNPGEETLFGEEVLQYVRFRGDAASDFGRVARQQEVLAKAQENIMDQLSSAKGIRTTVTMVKDGMSNVTTDIKLSDMVRYGITIVMNPVESFDTMRIPLEGSYENFRSEEAGLVLKMNPQENKDAIYQFLNGKSNLAIQ